MAKLGMNIDHVATLRQARRGVEPDPVWAASEAQLAGAHCITVHLREDRRHIQDHDVHRIAASCHVKLNLEMAATDEMVAFAEQLKPQMVTLVPEGRQEITTEGGLDVLADQKNLAGYIRRFKASGISSSAFIDPVPDQIAASHDTGFDTCEIHTGPYAAAFYAARGDMSPAVAGRLHDVQDAGEQIISLGMRFNAGHALNYANVVPVAKLPGLFELHIGHAIVSRAVFVGMRVAVEQMVALIRD